MLGFVGALALIILADRTLFAFTNDVVFGVYLGLVMNHFVIDAFVWRMSEPVQRQYIRESYPMIWD